jgi:cytochrome c oxidase cbb3-type subunit 1
MNGSTSSSVSTPTNPEPVARIDSSCRVLLLPIVSALVWLLISSLFALITSVKLHSPTVLADCSWLTYGHTRPAANDSFVYGFASQAGLAVALWILCRLGRTTLVGIVPIAIGSLFWNLGVTIGIVAILSGNSTGFDWLEFPSAGSAILLASYALIGTCALFTFKARRNEELYPSQWYILAALFWFPWLYTTARLLLIWFPVRGVMQLAVNVWFANGLFTLWLTSLALAVLFYFIPKLIQAPLHSRTLAVLGFWSLATFGCWAGFYRGLPLPGWMISAGVAATGILFVPLLCTVFNLWLTLGEGTAGKPPLLGFFKVSLVFFALSGVFAFFAAFVPQLRLTLFGEGVEQLALYGFIGLALFGAIHYITPRLTGVACEKFIGANCWGTLIGILVYAVAFIVCGMVQQEKLVNGVPFVDVMNSTKPFIRISTLGILLLIIGNAAILLRVACMARECCRHCCKSCCADETAAVKLKPAGATR